MFEKYTPQYLWNEIVPQLNTKLLTNEGSWLYDLFAPALLELYKVYLSLNALEPMFYIDESSGPYIDKMAESFGLARKQGTRAVCDIRVTGQPRSVVPSGTIFLTEDGLTFEVVDNISVETGVGGGKLRATQPGSRYNVGMGEIKRTQRAVQGLTSFVCGAATGGADDESDESLVERFYNKLQQLATSGNGYHYQQWARTVAGVGGARVIGLWAGAGTVEVLLVDDDNQPVDSSIVQAAQTYIDAQRPIGATVTCASATGVTITAYADVATASGADLSAIETEFRAALAEYLNSLVNDVFCAVIDAESESLSDYKTTVVYNKVMSLLIGCDGVIDAQVLTINNTAANVELDAQSVPVLGTVTLRG